jgi:hypothetical protein
MVKKTKPSRLTKALLETADDMRRVGVMDDATHQKITLATRAGASEPGRVRALPQSDHGVCVAVGAWRKAAYGTGAGIAEYHSP